MKFSIILSLNLCFLSEVLLPSPSHLPRWVPDCPLPCPRHTQQLPSAPGGDLGTGTGRDRVTGQSCGHLERAALTLQVSPTRGSTTLTSKLKKSEQIKTEILEYSKKLFFFLFEQEASCFHLALGGPCIMQLVLSTEQVMGGNEMVVFSASKHENNSKRLFQAQ